MTSPPEARRVLLLGRSAAAYADLLGSSLRTPWEIVHWHPDEPAAELARRLAGCVAVAVGPDALTQAGFTLAPYGLASRQELRLVQLAFSSHEWLRPEMLPPHAHACNVHAHAATMAEYVLACLLEWEIGLRRMDADLRRGDWHWSGALFGRPHGGLAGKRLGLLGAGAIAREVARRAEAFGVETVAVARTARAAAPGLAWIGGLERLDEMLTTCDYLVTACDLNDSTRGLLDRRRLGRLKPSAYVVSVTRAPIFDERALYEALRDRTIAGAAIDVWWRYPSRLGERCLPSQLPFHDLENVILTPHAASWTTEHHQRRWGQVAENLDRLAGGQPLAGVVHRPAG